MTARKKREGLPRVNVTPTKRKAILIYRDQLNMSFNAIANETEEFKNTSADHKTIAYNYRRAKQDGAYTPGTTSLAALEPSPQRRWTLLWRISMKDVPRTQQICSARGFRNARSEHSVVPSASAIVALTFAAGKSF
ncbi:hypothetical protein LshimejAT787_1600670 [Lyophyllum shimeji]|uniref:Uncharacterized protein n=1 Tax=Lyophyllum shimeji TaxID=47721 RepID=A0A9P3PRH5_LYOSH|nr:hypothetical protein LshimejAT787_0802090 [Lyophyllum shimeji]GLB40401.1 hypothetical protein LshimejAT787_0802720 [Lyophyllum shimeji]GLB44137.1 hypothetical protein LshimejAT787_1600670 [Lyophyllum shimeji]